MSGEDRIQLKMEKLRLMEEKLRLKQCLPHLYGYDFYPWQDKYLKSTNKKALVCAANQIGKSTIQIIKRLRIATNPKIWPELWPEHFLKHPNAKPTTWYLYPNQDTVMSEFTDKWVPYILPSGEYEDHPLYGWKEVITNKVLKSINFNTGFKLYFKTYNQNVKDLQSGTVFGIDCDEELPEDRLSELQARLMATRGYLSMAFTATMGQDIWYRAIERIGEDDELWKDAFKLQVSMYDCMFYSNGKMSPWTERRIKQEERNCKSTAEVNRRIKGKFVKDEGLTYTGFDRARNYKPYPKGPDGKYFKGVPKGWSVYAAIDLGSGGEKNHPTAYSFLSVNPEFTKIRWFRGRRLDKIETTAGDSFRFFRRDALGLDINGKAYDHAAKDFGTIATRAGESFNKAKKDHAIGEEALNTVLNSGAFIIYYDPTDEVSEGSKVAREFETLALTTPKNKAKDDYIDSIRYAIMEIPIDWEKLLEEQQRKEPEPEHADGSPEKERPNDYMWQSREEEKDHNNQIEEEIGEWAELY